MVEVGGGGAPRQKRGREKIEGALTIKQHKAPFDFPVVGEALIASRSNTLVVTTSSSSTTRVQPNQLSAITFSGVPHPAVHHDESRRVVG